MTRQEWAVVGIAVVLLLGIALVFRMAQWRTEDRIMTDAISRHLESVRNFLAENSSGPTYPTSQTASTLLAQAPDSVHTTHGLIDGFQYADKPVGRDASDVFVVAQVGQRHFGITGTGRTRELTPEEFGKLSLTDLTETGKNRTKPRTVP